MNKKISVVGIFFVTVVMISAGLVFYHCFVLEDYYVRNTVECDPLTESCFVNACNPVDDAVCPKDEQERINYYKFIEKKAKEISSCQTDGSSCLDLACNPGDSCRVILCDYTNITTGDECAYPEVYTKNLK
ncbi:MAG: hypothetical protein US58_C0012G0053 [Candidatus Magasanikbacteria bacterium GW2011_GWA2_37_8]|uniref:Uncharacterized protein n=1 Tax=Candidatus Magasanikbacteria bacterium GW2011_GWA2_37_8 TaxID=1619036 RepID=A0A0G0JVA4_9BACT|nr:MAG: hypothetical protein US58_C0012G0053 [Candidatus Magasanikbacteria bacterium GW2011_GWA2_37_8]